MARYRITIEYDGTPFVGWQSQPNGPSIQDALQQAIFKFSSETVTVSGAGRTDAGVHALGQVAHFDLTKDWDPFRIQEAINFHLKPDPISILECRGVGNDFEARFDATAREYLYRILSRRARPALDRDRVWWVPGALDCEAMHQAAQDLIGQHDFTTFRAAFCQAKSPVKTLDVLTVRQVDQEIHVYAKARSFLHHQVRSIVGSLKQVGEGRWPVGQVKVALEARDRAQCGAVAPPDGLYLVRVQY